MFYEGTSYTLQGCVIPELREQAVIMPVEALGSSRKLLGGKRAIPPTRAFLQEKMAALSMQNL